MVERSRQECRCLLDHWLDHGRTPSHHTEPIHTEGGEHPVHKPVSDTNRTVSPFISRQGAQRGAASQPVVGNPEALEALRSGGLGGFGGFEGFGGFAKVFRTFAKVLRTRGGPSLKSKPHEEGGGDARSSVLGDAWRGYLPGTPPQTRCRVDIAPKVSVKQWDRS